MATFPTYSTTLNTTNAQSSALGNANTMPMQSPQVKANGLHSASTPTSAPTSSRTSFSAASGPAFASPSQPSTPDVLTGSARQDLEGISHIDLPLSPMTPPVAPGNAPEQRRPSRQGLIRRFSNKTANKLRPRTSSSNLRNREQNAGPTVVRTRSGSRTLNDGTVDVSDLELDNLEESSSSRTVHPPLPDLPTSFHFSPQRAFAICKDPEGRPIIPPELLEPIKFGKLTKRKNQPIRLHLDQKKNKIVWHFEGQSSRKEVFIDDVTEVRTGKLARTQADELGYSLELVDRWLTVVYYDPGARGKGRSTHAMHLLANDASICMDLSRCLEYLIQDRRDLMAGISGNVDNDRSLARLWTETINKKYADLPTDRDAPLLDRDDMRRCCQNCLIYMSDNDFETRFKAADLSANDALSRAEFMQFFHSVHERADVQAIFDEHKSKNRSVMLQNDFLHFLHHSQGVILRDQVDQCEALFKKYADFHHGLGIVMGGDKDPFVQDAMTFDAFKRFFLDDNVPLPSSGPPPLLNRPLNEYYISSSHNTYLTGRQAMGHSSTEPYVDCLKQGCRCVEIDCWDGVDGEPWVTHGRTLTQGISFLSIIKAIKLWAFRFTQYPLIISLEVHCNPAQQRRMAEIMKKHFGKRMLQEPVKSMHPGLPSPEELKGRILIKVKEPMQPPTAGVQANSGANVGSHRRTRSKSEADVSPNSMRRPVITPMSPAEARVSPMLLTPPQRATTFDTTLAASPGLASMVTSSDETDSDAGLPAKQKRPKTSKIVPELGELGVYTRGITFTDFKSPASKKPTHIYSFNESTFKERLEQQKAQLEKHNRKYLMRVYPKGARLLSDNFDPLYFWRHGVQMAATNWQTYDIGTEINDAMFAHGHDRAGYVLKPDEVRMQREDSTLDSSTDVIRKVVKFSVTIISARHLHPLPNNTTINPYLEVEIFSADNPARGLATTEGGLDASTKRGMSGIGKPKRLRTKIIEGNGWDPVFNEQIDVGLETEYPSLVFVRFTAWNSPDGRQKSDQKNPLAAHTAKLSSLQQGYRLLHLRDKHGDNTVSKLLIKVRKEDDQHIISRRSSRDHSPESPRASEENVRGGRRILRGLFSRAPSERRKNPSSEPSSGIISRTVSTEK